MSATRSMTHSSSETLPAPLVFTLAAGAGLSVASIYYSQPMLDIISKQFNVGVGAVGMVPMLTQAGYALGILLLAPLGDRHDRRTIIFIKGLLLVAALLLCGFSGGLSALLIASFVTGLTATVAQDIVPASAALAPERSRGKTVGTVMTGLLVGILLSRVISGVVAEYFGWRTMYMVAALAVLLISLTLWRVLPRFTPGTSVSYPRLLLSLAHLWRHHQTLRRAALAQGLLSVGFSAFWSTLALMLSERFHLDSAVAGAFGLAGAAGAMAAPLAGSFADRIGPARVTQAGAALVTVSFALMFLLPLLPLPAQLALIVVSTIGFDLGVQATLVAHQTLVYGLAPEARSRLNALLFTVVFIGMASGAALGSLALAHWGWNGVVALSTLAGAASLAVRFASRHLKN
ncbi:MULTISPECIES: MFS transporter [Pantoea]|jgi:predicted MFS family arabinose efflux permease|uniref:MFS transporter n=1 Tax=Pantoea brenneri TaxID=472694 RepID=A0A653NKQ2_9GAMM|nr:MULTISPECIES: MFS transporter [Pantoea]KKD31229.1 MFS transporter [Pantoea sp. 3.5.1]MBS6034218.1 MFS transporter [Pantoea sp.]MBZ6395785.1 MFS transporter [Pantoea sp.]MBZ6439048.1 MFS transporter [Pantoea sp.]MCQ5472251.1 MFS transporter [Pantoea brenneri]